MSYLTLYRKWRPQTFAEVIGQSHVTETITRAIDTGRLAHAYLFCGPRGTGKTTTARILAKAINCSSGPTSTPCLKCEACTAIARGNYLDLLEIDAASHRRVEETRQLLDMIPLSPAHGRKKVYIIDEVHMLTTESFNTLLKTLEEPPDHVVFVLATTDPHNVPPTIHSRCQRFDFRAVPSKVLSEHLAQIAESEGIHADASALLQIARAHGGSVRDAVGTLEQLWIYCPGGITSKDVATILGTTEHSLIFEAVDLLESGSTADVIRFMRRLSASGSELRHFVHDLCRHYRDILLLCESPDSDDLIDSAPDAVAELKRQAATMAAARALTCARRLQQAELDIRLSADPSLFVEVLLLELLYGGVAPAPETLAPALPARAPGDPESARAGGAATEQRPLVPDSSSQPPASESDSPAPSPQLDPESARESAAAPVAPASDGAEAYALADVQAVWPQVLELLKQMNKASTAAYLGAARLLSYTNDCLTMGFAFETHLSRMEAAENRDALARILKEKVFGRPCTLRFVLDTDGIDGPDAEVFAPPEDAESGPAGPLVDSAPAPSEAAPALPAGAASLSDPPAPASDGVSSGKNDDDGAEQKLSPSEVIAFVTDQLDASAAEDVKLDL